MDSPCYKALTLMKTVPVTVSLPMKDVALIVMLTDPFLTGNTGM